MRRAKLSLLRIQCSTLILMELEMATKCLKENMFHSMLIHQIGTDLYNISGTLVMGLHWILNQIHGIPIRSLATTQFRLRSEMPTELEMFLERISMWKSITLQWLMRFLLQMKYLYLIQILSVRIFPILNPIWAWRFIEIRMSTTAPYRTGMRFCLQTSMFDGISILNLMQMETVTLQMTGSLQLQQQKVELLEFGRK